MADQSSDSARRKLGAAPGLCGTCVHAKLNETHRGTAYLRCTRAAWDARLPRYPRLPVTTCPGFEALDQGQGRLIARSAAAARGVEPVVALDQALDLSDLAAADPRVRAEGEAHQLGR